MRFSSLSQKRQRRQLVLLDDAIQHRRKALRVANLILHVVMIWSMGETNSAMPSHRLCSSTKRKSGSSAASAAPFLTPQVNFALLASMDFSLKRFTTIGFIVSTSTVARSKRAAMTSKMRLTSLSDKYIVKPSMMTRTSVLVPLISPPQSSIADMVICEIFLLSGRSFSRTAIVSGRSKLYQCA